MNKFVKKFFITFVLALILYSIFSIFLNKKKNSHVVKNIENNTIFSNNIRIGVMQLDTLNPILSNNKNVQEVSRLIFDPLFELTNDYKIKDGLAKEYSKIDSNTYLIKLKENIKWHDGNLLNSSDVIFTINIIKKLGDKSVYYYNTKNIAKVEELDEYTIKIITENEEAFFEYNLIFPIVSCKYFNEDNFNLESKNLKIIGTGKFYISDVSNNKIYLKRFDDYWVTGGENKLENIELKTCNSLGDIINEYKNLEIDFFTTSNSNINSYLENYNYNKNEYINRNYMYMALNYSDKILKNKEVRQAINYAINKKEIVSQIGNCTISNFPLDFGCFAYSEENEYVSYNEEMARKILIDNNWEYNSNRWIKKNNGKIELELVVNKNDNTMVKTADIISSQLSNIGIYIKIIEANNKQYNSYIINKNYDLILLNNSYSYSPSLNKYYDENNIANYCNEEIGEILEDIETLNIDDLNKKYKRIVELYNEDVIYISLFFNTSNLIYSNNVRGLITPNSYNPYIGIEKCYREYEN